ncbi:MAG: TolC family protein, partial [Bacteroidia bacterium]|nr:TolC family protein [Bacteroidia bacterium]
MLKKGLIYFLLFASYSCTCQTLDSCERQFTNNNLLLIAGHFNIDISRAAVIQAKIWDLPYLSTEINAFNPSANRVFDAGAQGQKTLAIQQLILIGNKRKNEIAFNNSNVEIAELQFEDILRNLRFELRQNFYEIYFEQKKLAFTDTTLANLDSLITTYRIQAGKGNLPLKDLVRLQSLYFSIKNDRNAIVLSILEAQEKLKIIRGLNTDVRPVVSLSKLSCFKNPVRQLNTDSLIEQALASRPDYLAAIKQSESGQWMLKLQKSLAVPNVTLGASYDQRGGAFNNQVNLTLGVPLPLWNRNKGNIMMAQARNNQYLVGESMSKNEIINEVNKNYSKWKEASDNYGQYVLSKYESFDKIYLGIITNFRKKNINIMEFTDFMESYNLSMQQINDINKKLVIASEELNTT